MHYHHNCYHHPHSLFKYVELKQSQYDFNSTLSSDDDDSDDSDDDSDDLLYPSKDIQHGGHNASGGGDGIKGDVGGGSLDNETGLSPRSKYIDSCIRYR